MNLIRAVLEKSGLSQMELARRIGCSRSTIQRMGRGYRDLSLKEITEFADILGMTRIGFIRWIEQRERALALETGDKLQKIKGEKE